MVKCLVSQQQQGSRLNSLELNPVRHFGQQFYARSRHAHPGYSQLEAPLSHGLDLAELAPNICPQGMCLDHIRSRSQSRRSKLSSARSIRDRAVNLQSAAYTSAELWPSSLPPWEPWLHFENQVSTNRYLTQWWATKVQHYIAFI